MIIKREHNEPGFTEEIDVKYPNAGNLYGICTQRLVMEDGTIKERRAELFLSGINGPDGKIGWYSKDFGPWQNV